MKKYSIILFLLIGSINLFAQEQGDFKNFLSLFPQKKLPFYVIYSHSDFKEEHYKRSEDDTTDGCTGYTGELTIDSAGPLPFEQVRKYLFDSTNNAIYNRLDSESRVGWGEYYSIGLLKAGKNYYVLALGEVQRFSNEESNEDQYLCTISKQGHLISKIEIGEAGYQGTGICGNDSDYIRVPYYGPTLESYIDKDLTIRTGSDLMDSMEETLKNIKERYPTYFIDKEGNIKKYIIKH